MQLVLAHYSHLRVTPKEHTYAIPQSICEIRPKLEDEKEQATYGPIDVPAEAFGFIEKVMQNKALDRRQILEALAWIKKLHTGQKRLSGEPFYLHPLAVAEIVLGFKQESTMVVAALLHDLVEDSHTWLDQVALLFGAEVAKLVDPDQVWKWPSQAQALSSRNAP